MRFLSLEKKKRYLKVKYKLGERRKNCKWEERKVVLCAKAVQNRHLGP